MAESVDALVSNTNAARRAGSTPALGTQNPFRCKFEGVFAFFGKLLANYSIFRDLVLDFKHHFTFKN
jgi:hypothetical protein